MYLYKELYSSTFCSSLQGELNHTVNCWTAILECGSLRGPCKRKASNICVKSGQKGCFSMWGIGLQRHVLADKNWGNIVVRTLSEKAFRFTIIHIHNNGYTRGLTCTQQCRCMYNVHKQIENIQRLFSYWHLINTHTYLTLDESRVGVNIWLRLIRQYLSAHR